MDHALLFSILYGVLLTPFAILGIAAQVRRIRTRRAPSLPPTDWAHFDVPTFIRKRNQRRASGANP